MATTKAKKTPAKQQSTPERSYNVRPDSLDFRDLMYVSTLVEVPSQIDRLSWVFGDDLNLYAS